MWRHNCWRFGDTFHAMTFCLWPPRKTQLNSIVHEVPHYQNCRPVLIYKTACSFDARPTVFTGGHISLRLTDSHFGGDTKCLPFVGRKGTVQEGVTVLEGACFKMGYRLIPINHLAQISVPVLKQFSRFSIKFMVKPHSRQCLGLLPTPDILYTPFTPSYHCNRQPIM